MPADKRIAEFVEGYRRADAYLEQERIARLARLTPEAARAEFDDLTEGWERLQNKGEHLQRLDPWRVETLVALRRAFEALARARGWL
jgi:hypothetical protein